MTVNLDSSVFGTEILIEMTLIYEYHQNCETLTHEFAFNTIVSPSCICPAFALR